MAAHLVAMCLFNMSDYRQAGQLSPCKINATTGRVDNSAAPANFYYSDSSLCNVAFRPDKNGSSGRFYVPNMPGGEWAYTVNIIHADTGVVEGKVNTQNAPGEGMMWTYFAWDGLNDELYAYGDLENGTNVGIAMVDAISNTSSGKWTLLDYGVPGWIGAGSFDCSGGFSTLHEPGTLGAFYASYIGKFSTSNTSGISTHAIAAYDISEHKMLAAWDTTECMDNFPDTYCQTGDILPWIAPGAPENAMEGVLAFQFVNGTNEPPIQPGYGHIQLVLYHPQPDGTANFTVLYNSYNASDAMSGIYLTDTFAGTLAGVPGSWLVYRPVMAGQYGTDLRLLTWNLSTTPARIVNDVPLHGPAFDKELNLFTITNMFAVT